MNFKKYIVITAMAMGLIGSLALVATASAQTTGSGSSHWGMGQMPPGVFGKVTAISGDTITVQSSGRPMKGSTATATTTTYTVDATNATVTKNNAASSVSSIVVGDNVMVQGTVSGTNVTATAIRDGMPQGRGMMPGVFGKVTAISGDTITVQSSGRPMKGSTATATTTTYTVDATNATVTKNGATSSVSDIAVGDTIMVQGTVSGSSVTATSINDGVGAQKQPVVQGNGQPIVAGKVTAVNGDSVTITNSSNVTYTIDATNAKIVKNNALGSLSDVSSGENIVVQGGVNGTNVTAYSITIQNTPKTALGSGSQNTLGGPMGFFEGIGNFFKRLFGF